MFLRFSSPLMRRWQGIIGPHGMTGGCKTVLTECFARAVDYARIAHADQTRKGTDIPYLTHLLSGLGNTNDN